jgi:adenine deaminase
MRAPALEDAIARVRQGMRAMLRLGSAWYDVATQIKAITEKGLDSRNFILCTDDCHSGTLVNDGHMNRVVRHAIAWAATGHRHPDGDAQHRQHFGLERELGSITPGRRADLILTSDLVDMPIELVIARGKTVAENGRLTVTCPHYDWPQSARNTVRMGPKTVRRDFVIPRPTGERR